MAELTITTFMTIDGVMQAPGGEAEDASGGFAHGGWLVPHFDGKLGETMDEIFAKAGAFLLGRKTFEIFASYWPQVHEEDNVVAQALNSLPKYVASRGTPALEWEGSHVVRDVVAEVAKLKAQYAAEIQVHGSSDLAQTLIKHDLIDEYRIITFPVVIGSGKRLFGAGTIPRTLALVKSIQTTTGVMIGYYRNTRELRTGQVE